MSVPTAEPTAPSLGAHQRPSIGGTRLVGGWRTYGWLGAAALVIAATTLLLPSTPSYDPWSWLVWGREILHGTLHTQGGPTWKPLPIIFATIFAIFGAAQANLWLVVARAGAVLATLMTFKLAARLTWWLRGRSPTGRRLARAAPRRRLEFVPAVLAGLIAAVGLALSGNLLSDSALGYSEALATAVLLIGVERHVDGHCRQAFVLGFVAALARPEIWLFWGPYGLWLMWKDPGSRTLVIGLALLCLFLWFVPAEVGWRLLAERLPARSASAQEQPGVRLMPVLHRAVRPRLEARAAADQGRGDPGDGVRGDDPRPGDTGPRRVPTRGRARARRSRRCCVRARSATRGGS